MLQKVAIINSVIDYGSTGSLARQLFEYGNQNGYEMYAFYGRPDKSQNNYEAKKSKSNKRVVLIDSKLEVYIHKFLSLVTGFQGSFSNCATTTLIRCLNKIDCQTVILLNVHGYYLNEKRLFDFFRKRNIKIVYIMPDEYAGLGKCAYANECEKFKTMCQKCPNKSGYPKSLFFDTSRYIFNKKLKEYKGQDITFACPKANMDHLKDSFLLKNYELKELDWGIDLDKYFYSVDPTLYQIFGIPKGKILVLTVAKYSEKRKGVEKYFFGTARRFIDENWLDYHFIQVGYDGKLPADEIPENITVIPYVDNQSVLTQLYSMSDLYVLASTSDTMPISCLIALACETPVACFYEAGLKYISNGDMDIVKYADTTSLEGMVKLVRSTRRKNLFIRKKCRNYAEERFSKERFNERVFSLCKK